MTKTPALHPWLDVNYALELGLIDDKATYAGLLGSGKQDSYYGWMIKNEIQEGSGLIGVKPEAWILNTSPKAMAADRERFVMCRVADLEGLKS